MNRLDGLKLVLGSALLAMALYAILALPGLLTDAPAPPPQRVVAVRP